MRRKDKMLLISLLAIAALALFLLNRGAPSPQLIFSGRLSKNASLYFVDVGQGDGMFLDYGTGVLVVDAGRREMGERVVAALSRDGKSKVDFLAASGHDADHAGGLIEVMNSLPVESVWDSGSQKGTVTFREFKALASQRNFSVVTRGRVFWLNNFTSVTVLNPVQPLEFQDENDNSLVLRVTVGRVSVLLEGDCEEVCEKSILASGLNVSSQILKVGHHGSRTSSSQVFLNAVSPRIALIGVGEGNAYGHPHEEVLQRLAAMGVQVNRTDYDGTIVVKTDGADYWVEKG
jgi:competence protein ComEC